MKYISFEIGKDIKVKKFLEKNDFSKRAINYILKDGYLIDGIRTSKNQYLKSGDILNIPIIDENIDYEPIKGKIEIAYEDEHILVVEKDYNITVNSKGQESLANHIAYYFKKEDLKAKVRLVNRLDMNTSGLLMIAKNPYAFAYYQSQIENNKFSKNYLAVVKGKVNIDKLLETRLAYDKENKRYMVSDQGKLAISEFKTLNYDEAYDVTYINVDIKSGKTHQIRSQLSYLGHPIIGDKLYGSNVDIERFLLHCYKIKFYRFIDNKTVELVSNNNFDKFLQYTHKIYL